MKKKENIELTKDYKIRLKDLGLKFNGMRGDDLLIYIFDKYPFYAVNSNNTEGLLNSKQLNKRIQSSTKQAAVYYRLLRTVDRLIYKQTEVKQYRTCN